MSNTKESGGFALQVTAGALAAATAALLGSTLGVAGTVLGAGIASVVTTVGAALYLRSLQKVHHRWTESLPAQRAEDRNEDEQPEQSPRRRLGWPALAIACALAFALGMLAITGLEVLRGEPVSGGQGTTIGDIVNPARPPAERPDPPTTTPAPTETRTVTVTPPPPSQPAPPSTTTTTSVPPTTTTTSDANMTTVPPDRTLP